jgi:hypothetical protein
VSDLVKPFDYSDDSDAGLPESFSTSSSSLLSSQDEKALDTPLTDAEVDITMANERYQAKDFFRTDRGERYHPYSPDDASYMQSYSRIQMDK